MAVATDSTDARLVDIASQAGGFVERLLRRLAETEVELERRIPVFPRRGAPVLTVEEADRLAGE